MNQKKLLQTKEFISKISSQIIRILYKNFPQLPVGDKEGISQEV
ncbi:MAG: hypothetical protein ACOC5G_03280 [Acidobacteriota bacterium]